MSLATADAAASASAAASTPPALAPAAAASTVGPDVQRKKQLDQCNMFDALSTEGHQAIFGYDRVRVQFLSRFV